MFDAKNLHHAYVIEGNMETGLTKVRNFLKKDLKISLLGNPDLFDRSYESFGIEDAREVKDFLMRKALGQYKIFVLGIPSMTSQSANALLKSLEEPSAGTHFFIVVPNSKRLLSTLLSRVTLLKLDKDEGEIASAINISPSSYLKLPETKRLEKVKELLNLYDKEDIMKQDIVSFFQEVLTEYRNRKDYDPKALKNAVTAVDYMSDTSSSLKILMEYISLILK